MEDKRRKDEEDADTESPDKARDGEGGPEPTAPGDVPSPGKNPPQPPNP